MSRVSKSGQRWAQKINKLRHPRTGTPQPVAKDNEDVIRKRYEALRHKTLTQMDADYHPDFDDTQDATDNESITVLI